MSQDSKQMIINSKKLGLPLTLIFVICLIGTVTSLGYPEEKDLGTPGSPTDCPKGHGIQKGYLSGDYYIPGVCKKNDENCRSYDDKNHKCLACDYFYVLLDNESGRASACQFAVQLLLPVIIISLLLVFLVSYLVYESWFVKPEKLSDIELLERELEGTPFKNEPPTFKVGLDFGKNKPVGNIAMSFKSQGETIEISDIDDLFAAFSGETNTKISGIDGAQKVMSKMDKS
jgi:hypothetical protein